MGTKNYMHRDIKPDNIFVKVDETTQKVQVKVGDLGLAKFQRNPRSCRVSLSQEGLSFDNLSCVAGNMLSSNDATSAIGTYAYMAPEQRRSHYNNKVDIYSLGMLLWELNETELDRDERHFTLMRLRKTGLCDLCHLKTPQSGKFIEWMMTHAPACRPTAAQILEQL